MAVLPVKLYPDPVLREVAKPVTDFGSELHKILDDMTDTMYARSGIGLAAPQVGISARIAVVDVENDGSRLLHLVNPEVVSSAGKVDSEEGCLSIPGFRDTITRAKSVLVRAQDRHGEHTEIEADGLLGICMQHEIDHLNGVLFIDHLSRLKRELFKRWLKKQAADDA